MVRRDKVPPDQWRRLTLRQIAAVYFHPVDEHGHIEPELIGTPLPGDSRSDRIDAIRKRYGVTTKEAARLWDEEQEVLKLRAALNDQRVDCGEVDRRAEQRRVELIRGRSKRRA